MTRIPPRVLRNDSKPLPNYVPHPAKITPTDIKRGKQMPRRFGPPERGGRPVDRGKVRSITPPGGVEKALAGGPKVYLEPNPFAPGYDKNNWPPRNLNPIPPQAPPTGGPVDVQPVGAPDVMNPVPPAAGINPYTGQPLGANEYVGVAGSEAEHPGQTRIPSPGWWDPSNPNYERRAYYHDAAGNVVAIEPGYQGDAEHPFDTGRQSERNTEYGRTGEGIIRMSQPGVPTWSPGQQRPKMGEGLYPTGPGITGGPQPIHPVGLDALRGDSRDAASFYGSYLQALRGGNRSQTLSDELLAALLGLSGKARGGSRSIPA